MKIVPLKGDYWKLLIPPSDWIFGIEQYYNEQGYPTSEYRQIDINKFVSYNDRINQFIGIWLEEYKNGIYYL